MQYFSREGRIVVDTKAFVLGTVCVCVCVAGCGLALRPCFHVSKVCLGSRGQGRPPGTILTRADSGISEPFHKAYVLLTKDPVPGKTI